MFLLNKLIIIKQINYLRCDISLEDILKAQEHDKDIKLIKSDLRKFRGKNSNNKYYVDSKTQLLMYLHVCNVNKEKKLTKLIVVPKVLQKDVLKLMHVSHFGVDKTYLLLRERYFWPGSYSDTQNFVASCDQCCS